MKERLIRNKFGEWHSYLGDMEFEHDGTQYVLAIGCLSDLQALLYVKVFKDDVVLYSRYVVNGTFVSTAGIPMDLAKKCLHCVERMENLRAFL